MAEKKKQHYVPRFYLRHFLADSIHFYLYNVNADKEIGLVSHKDQCYGNYFYGKNKAWEDKLAEKERDWNIAFDKVLNGDYSKIDTLREFAVFQLARTKTFNDRLTKSASRQLEEMLKTELAGRGLPILREAVKKASNKEAKEITNPSSTLAMINELVGTISDLAFLRIHYKTKRKLISSDNPVLLINPYLPPHVGLRMIGLMILFPMDSENLGLFYDKKMYTRFRNKEYYESKNNAEVRNINSLTFANAGELLFSAYPFEKSLFAERNRQLRNDNLRRDTVGRFGVETNKLIVTRQPTIFHDFNLSFAFVDRVFHAIDKDCRDSVPRIYNQKWERKLYDKWQTWFIDMAWRYMDVDKEKYRRGYKAFYDAMLMYWGEDKGETI